MNLYKEKKVVKYGKSIDICTAQNNINSIMVFLNYREILCVPTHDEKGKWNSNIDNLLNKYKKRDFLDIFLYQVDNEFLQNEFNKHKMV